MAKTTAVAKYSRDDVFALDTVVEEYSLGKLAGLSPFEQTFRLGAGIQKLKRMITSEMMGPIMDLQGTALGFRTDKDKTGGYDEETVKDCLIEATLRGVRPTGNEFNIISERSYITREGATRLVREFPGLTDLAMDLGVPHLVPGKGGATVQAAAKWKLNGTAQELSCEIPVRVNAGMGADAILGKAERKLLVRIYRRITGSITISDGDVADMAAGAPQIANKGTAAVKAQLMGPEEKPAEPSPFVDSLKHETRSPSAMPQAEEIGPLTPAPSPADQPPSEPAPDKNTTADRTQQISRLYDAATTLGIDDTELARRARKKYGASMDEMLAGEIKALTGMLVTEAREG